MTCNHPLAGPGRWGVCGGKGNARSPLPDPGRPVNQGLHSSVTVRQMAAVVGGAQQESGPVIFPVANRPDFLWLSASLEWLREGRRAAGVGPWCSSSAFFSKGASHQGLSFFPMGRAGARPHILFLRNFLRVCEWQS